jgi:hypothetical protein
MYSSIEEENRHEVINKCYWPLLKLADAGIPFGVEAPAVTLELIQDIDSEWIAELSKYIKNGKIEFIGSGYSQLIGPLVPAKVNRWNQKLGLEIYDRLLDVKPIIALVNEMAYSSGILEHYIDVGYEGGIMEWNNPRSSYPEWENEWRYFPQKAVGNDGLTMPLIWADSIAFQKFQRYAHGEYELDQYVKYIKSHIGESVRFFPLYSNDVEIFDYRPGRYFSEAQFDDNSEWKKIIDLYSHLNHQDWCEFVFPSQVLIGLNNKNSGQKLKFESPAQPVPVKKQEKYNINRWALTGRDDVGINSKCYKIYNSYFKNDNNSPDDWKELCYLWSSDFRTHITEKRWGEYIDRLNALLAKIDFTNKSIKDEPTVKLEVVDVKKQIIIENNNYKVVLNKNKGLTIQELVIKKFGIESLMGTLDHGYYDDISLGADYYSGHAIIERPGEHKVADLGNVIPVIDQNGDGIVSIQKWGNYSFNQILKFENKKLVFEKHIEADSPEKAIIRPYNFTFNPEAWDRESLYVATHNGGSKQERFDLKGQKVSHGDIYSSLISARHGFGNTEGLFVIGDKYKSINFECDMSTAALIPSIIYKEMDGTFFFRLQYSAREMDETLMKKRLKLHTKLIIHG